ncbi:hypothetical protein ACHAXR_007397 [Thalassiosira sp. AJA248-18]
MYCTITVFILTLWAIALVAGKNPTPENGMHEFNQNGSAMMPSLRSGRLLRRDSSVAKTLERQLLPHPHKQDSKQYRGCLGLSKEEREEAWIFSGEMPPCTISVEGSIVVGDASANGDESGGSVANGNGNSSNGDGSSNSANSGNSDVNSGGGGQGGSSSESGNSGSSSSNVESGYKDGSSYNGSGGSGSNGGTSNNDSVGSNAASSGNGDGSSSSAGGSDGGTSSYVTSSGSGEGDNEVGGDASLSNSLRYFNISDCGTYSHIWLWDLALTCENSTSLESCECTSASILYQYGELDCPGTSGSPSCPVSCPACNTCMRLLGCSSDDVQGEQRVPKVLEQDMTRALPIALGITAAVTSLVLGVSIYQYKRRDIASGGLGAGFMRDAPPLNPIL